VRDAACPCLRIDPGGGNAQQQGDLAGGHQRIVGVPAGDGASRLPASTAAGGAKPGLPIVLTPAQRLPPLDHVPPVDAALEHGPLVAPEVRVRVGCGDLEYGGDLGGHRCGVLGDVFGDLLPADALLCAGAAVECGQCAGEALAALDEQAADPTPSSCRPP